MTIPALWQAGWTAMLVNHLWQSTAVAVIAWLLTLALRKNNAADPQPPRKDEGFSKRTAGSDWLGTCDWQLENPSQVSKARGPWAHLSSFAIVTGTAATRRETK